MEFNTSSMTYDSASWTSIYFLNIILFDNIYCALTYLAEVTYVMTTTAIQQVIIQKLI